MTVQNWTWERATDVDEVHDLLCASDTHVTGRYGSPVPVRRRESTDRLVSAGEVRLLRRNGRAAATFTLTTRAPFSPAWEREIYPPARRAVYLMRLSVRPDLQTDGSLIGLRCVRKAIEVAADTGADVLRSETNPDLTATLQMLFTVGFTQYGPILSDEGDRRRRIYLQKDLHP
ncbi:hypothetical protein V6U90_24780 [Micromonospora sp. CPCC 206060]|uniref:hypothetical protein n=1 Tax=Micromonospora sp. CPCC 206060 TaxID=3122406 RepID=UPI002FF3329B